MELIDRIYMKAEERKITISSLEKRANLSNGQIGKWKLHNQKPSYDKIYSVAKTLEVTTDWLITGKEAEDLTPLEKILIENYRICNTTGKRRILETAEEMKLLYPDLPTGVSTSSNGKTGTDN